MTTPKKLTAAEKEQRSEQGYLRNREARDAARKQKLAGSLAQLDRTARICSWARARRASMRYGATDPRERKKFRLTRRRELMAEFQSWAAACPLLAWESDEGWK